MSESYEACDKCGKKDYQWVDEKGFFTCDNCGEENCHPMDVDEEWENEVKL